ncbi:MAG: 50S ribosomal protein L11 methyltransferase [Candidatus Limnocylindria bacterium]
MRWLELSIDADVEAVEAVSEILGRVAEGTAVHPTRLLRDPDNELSARADPTAPFVVTAHLPDNPSAAGAVDATERALWHLQAFGLRPLGSLRVRQVDDATWIETWKEHYITQRIGRIVITPSWAPEETASPDVPAIVLDPGMAFGTGLHPTTRGCLEMMQEVGSIPSRVLDVGCGSGVLSLAAIRLGAARVVAIDTDPLAVTATEANAARNGIGASVDVRSGTLDDGDDQYALILANLVAAVLVELAPRLSRHLAPGGTLIASGIIEPRASEVIGAMDAAGLSCVTRRDDGDWVSLRLDHAG